MVYRGQVVFWWMLVVVLLSAGQVQAGERFVANADGTVTDNKTGLTWAAADNGKDINWHDADIYAREFRAGGHSDWRLPTLAELMGLYDRAQREKSPYGITPLIHLSDCCVWTDEVNLDAAAVFSFKTGNKPWSFLGDDYQLRVLPVRGEMPDPEAGKNSTAGKPPSPVINSIK